MNYTFKMAEEESPEKKPDYNSMTDQDMDNLYPELNIKTSTAHEGRTWLIFSQKPDPDLTKNPEPSKPKTAREVSMEEMAKRKEYNKNRPVTLDELM
jgi:hypothetical protein